MVTDYLIIDVILTLLGVYLSYASFSMWKTKKINSIIVTEQELKRCKDKTAFCNYVSPRLLVFAITSFVVGGVGILSDTIIEIRYWPFIQLVAFLIVFTLFTIQLKSARKKYCS